MAGLIVIGFTLFVVWASVDMIRLHGWRDGGRVIAGGLFVLFCWLVLLAAIGLLLGFQPLQSSGGL